VIPAALVIIGGVVLLIARDIAHSVRNRALEARLAKIEAALETACLLSSK
jgi:hypothetical protein